jgi:hypothetical protein
MVDCHNMLNYTADVYKTLIKGIFTGWICQSFRFPFGRTGQRLRCVMQKRNTDITDDDMIAFREGGWLVHELDQWTTAEITVASSVDIEFAVSDVSITAIQSHCMCHESTGDHEMCVDIT